MVNREDEQFESYLKRFRPVAPQPLPAKKHLTKFRRPFAIAAGVAAALAATLIVVLLLSRSRDHALRTGANSPAASGAIANAEQATIAAPALTKLALENPEAFDALMTERLQRQMPLMKGEQSALRVLAKE